MGKKKNKLPSEWTDYSKFGKQVEGTRFIAFKVPLKQEICRNLSDVNEWFTPAMLLENIPKLKLIISLTNTDNGRYYYESDFTTKGVSVLRLQCVGGGTLPPLHIMTKFFNAVDNFRHSATDKDSLIGVHCTHGLNRTGYFICKYMVDRLNIPVNKAIEYFEAARGHKIARQQYITALGAAPARKPLIWRARPPSSTYSQQNMRGRYAPDDYQYSGNSRGTYVRSPFRNEDQPARSFNRSYAASSRIQYQSPLSNDYDDQEAKRRRTYNNNPNNSPYKRKY